MQVAARGSKVVRGVTLVEACIVLAILAVLAGSALPSFSDTLKKRRFDGAVAEIPTEVNFARSAAVTQGRGAWLSYTQVAGGSCAMVHVGAKTDCSCAADGQPVCIAGATALKATLHAVPVSVAAPIHFDSTNGTVTPTATIRIEMASGKELHHKVNIMGRVRSCSPAGAVKGYPAC
jgi:type IV fimbrial biogenesis protein FimT